MHKRGEKELFDEYLLSIYPKHCRHHSIDDKEKINAYS
jgi:hypothetical protein